MAKPLFYVDLSEDARDYRHTALEPGLPLLDRQGVNFQILRQWLGDFVAEPEWRNQNTVAFYMVDEERGRLEDVDCHPVTRSELEKEKGFAKDLDAIRAKIKKIKPESSTEQMVHRILKKSIAEQTNDLENSDFDSFFFKCRAGKEEWRLVWCCGYQRADLEPLRAKIWTTPDGDYLGVRPPAQGGRARKRKRTGAVDRLTSPWLALALLLLLGVFLYASWPKLSVSPAQWDGPMGSRIEYKVQDRRWFFFNRDVTVRALAQSNDPRVVDFDRGGVAEAKSVGTTFVSFRLGNRIVDARVEVGPPAMPESLTIEPAGEATVAIGSTRKLKAVGHYKDGSQVDLSNLVNWWEPGDKRLLVVHESDKGLIEGDSSGATKIVAQFPTPRDDQTFVEATADVKVVLADFTSLAVSLHPQKFAVGQNSRVDVLGIDRQGQQHSLSGSSLLQLKVDPKNLASVDGGYLLGRAEGSGEVQVAYGELEKSVGFTIAGRALPEDIFLVSPSSVENAVVYELVPLNVTTGTDEAIQAESADPAVVEVFRTEGENAGYEIWLAARRAGQAEIKVSQGSKSQTVKVIVTDGLIDDLQFKPPVYALKVGEGKEANLVATTQDGRQIKVVPDALVWERLPRVENVYVDRQTCLLRGLEPTEVPQPLRVTLASTALTADATVEVAGGDLLALLDQENGFGVHPPVPIKGKYLNAGSYIGDDVLMYDDTRGLIVGSNVDPFSPLGVVPRGSQLIELNGVSLAGMTPDELAAYFRQHRIGEGDVLRYRGGDGVLGTVLLGERVGVVRDFRLLDVLSTNVTSQSFDADLRLYLRQSGEYRLTDSAGTPLSEWTAYPQDATPLVSVSGIARNAADDYELYVERRIGEQVKRFQVPFNLEPERAQAIVAPVEPAPVVVDTPDLGPVIQDDDPDGQRVRVKKTTRTIRRPASGDGAARGPADDGTLPVSTPAPGSPAPAPGSPAPAPGSPAPAPGSPAPAPGSPAPGAPAPAPAKPAPASPAKPDAKPVPAAEVVDSDPRPAGAPIRAGAQASPAATGQAARGTVAGKAARGSSDTDRSRDDDRSKRSPLLDALKNYNRGDR